mgnify:CR=1 FL=1
MNPVSIAVCFFGVIIIVLLFIIDLNKIYKIIGVKYEISNNRNDIVVVAQGPRNRIRDLLLLYDNKKYDI